MAAIVSNLGAFANLRIRGASDTDKEASYTLTMSIGGLFSALIVVLGIVLVAYNFERSKDLARATASDFFDGISRQTADGLSALYGPVETAVDMTARLEAAGSKTLAGRLAMLGYFAETLQANAQLNAMFIGYANGDFFLVRAIRGNATVRESLAAPVNAEFVVQSVERGDVGEAVYQTLYFDSSLFPLGFNEKFNTGYDPRARSWYQRAIRDDGRIVSDYYTFFTTRETGLTIARQLHRGNGVVAADVTVRDLSTQISTRALTPSTELLVFDREGHLLGYSDLERLIQLTGERIGPGDRTPRVTDIDRPFIDEAFRQFASGTRNSQITIEIDGERWLSAISPLSFAGHEEEFLAILVPERELFTELEQVRRESLSLSAVILTIALMLAWWISRRITNPVRALAVEADAIRQLDLDDPIDIRSRIVEVDGLATAMATMKVTIKHFTDIARALSAEEDFDRLLEMILLESSEVSGAKTGSILLLNDDEDALDVAIWHDGLTARDYGGTTGVDVPFPSVRLDEGDVEKSTMSAAAYAVTMGETVVIDDTRTEQRFGCKAIDARHSHGDAQGPRPVLLLPLKLRSGETVGLLELGNPSSCTSGDRNGFPPPVVNYIEALASNAAIAIENRRLLLAQKELFDCLIRLMAAAIDAKSPYTGGHCQRVPAAAMMLAEAASESSAPPFDSFTLSEDDREEFRIACWLHDCGKVTTPEYVVDKATKLETIYNRIHEVRMRFEVLLRDAHVDYYRALATAGEDHASLREKLESEVELIKEDFEFIAECNVGAEFISPEKIERIGRIAERRWTRHLDDRLGVSSDELERKQRSPAAALPVEEPLLADKKEHLVFRRDDGNPWGDNPHAFRMEVPEHEYNFGEIYNLGIARGTLTSEERFKISEHMTQTIIMLCNLPFPKELRRVPDWAASHHEKLDGTGYPRRLDKDSLGVHERIVAIADIFEALTAADRPYKSSKTLSETLNIMSRMRDGNHICPDLFDLFLESGVHAKYAESFLLPEQIDAVDARDYMSDRAREPQLTD